MIYLHCMYNMKITKLSIQGSSIDSQPSTQGRKEKATVTSGFQKDEEPHTPRPTLRPSGRTPVGRIRVRDPLIWRRHTRAPGLMSLFAEIQSPYLQHILHLGRSIYCHKKPTVYVLRRQRDSTKREEIPSKNPCSN